MSAASSAPVENYMDNTPKQFSPKKFLKGLTREIIVPVVLALILGPIGERGLRRSLTLSSNDISILFSTPICWILIALCILSSFSPILMKVLKKREK